MVPEVGAWRGCRYLPLATGQQRSSGEAPAATTVGEPVYCMYEPRSDGSSSQPVLPPSKVSEKELKLAAKAGCCPSNIHPTIQDEEEEEAAFVPPPQLTKYLGDFNDMRIK